MKFNLPISVVSDIIFNSARRLVECSKSVRPVAARNVREFILAAPANMQGDIKNSFRDAVAHYRFFKGVK